MDCDEQTSHEDDLQRNQEYDGDGDLQTCSSRKRLRTNQQDDSMSAADDPSVTTLSIKEEQMPPITGLALEAIFHPKFENENRNDQSIRDKMKQLVRQSKGYIEVSLKHSGSLILWSGGQRYYSKNATCNQFTYVGEVLLRQHFYRSWFDEKSEGEERYKECSSYIQQHRLTLAFEVVTAILGHHGDLPRHDFLVLTAVANRSNETFYSTSQLLQFCHQFRLPHNDTWVFSEERAVKDLFHLYDSTRETGLADDTIAALNRVSDLHIPCMYPHTVFQGNILEGIVIRYVPYHDNASELELLQSSAAEAERILSLVPPERPPSFALVQTSTTLPTVLVTNVREIARDVMMTGDRAKVASFLETSLCRILTESDGGARRKVDRNPPLVEKEWNKNFPGSLKKSLGDQEVDSETKRIAKVIETLDSIKSHVDYRVVKESTKGEPDRWLCIVHVFHDTAHQKFQKRKDPKDMSLFRGFCIELCTAPLKDSFIDADDRSGTGDAAAFVEKEKEGAGLMLKMKFLPYMVRTFGCRNGLRVISQNGPLKFAEGTTTLMTSWGISPQAKARWQPFFRAWGHYAHKCLQGETNEYTDSSLPKLCDSFYLDHLDHFTKLYERSEFASLDDEQAPTSRFHGLVIVVGLTREKAETAAQVIGRKMGDLYRRQGMETVTQDDLISACLLRDRVIVCSAAVTDGTKGVRKKLQDYGEAMFAILAGCDESALKSLSNNADGTTGNEESMAISGMVQSWRKTRFTKLLEITEHELLGAGMSGDDEMSTQNIDDVVQKVVDQLQEVCCAMPQRDDRPGLLVFFPSIPGSGKSTLCSSDSENDLCRSLQQTSTESVSSHAREVIVRVGDEVKKKYWTLVKVEKAKNPSSIYIADKNAPPDAWSGVGLVCSLSHNVAVPVIPDGIALQTTTVEGAKHYPFSLYFLAVCVARVIERPEETHAGKLDKSTDLACMVVVKFFALYRGISADEFLPTLYRKVQSQGAIICDSPIRVPFFAETDLPALPPDLEGALEDAIRIQYEYDVILNSNVANDDERVQEVENRLRDLLVKHKDMIRSFAVDPAISKHAFVSQVIEKAAMLDASCKVLASGTSGVMDASRFIKIVSIDIGQAWIHSLMRSYAQNHSGVSALIAQWTGGDGTAIGSNAVFPGDGFVGDTHVTMVHFSQMSQSAIRSKFEALIGCDVNVTVTGILSSSRVAALAVAVATEPVGGLDVGRVPAPENAFPHITLWHQHDASAAESNDLPGLVQNGGAERIDFDEPAVIHGTLSFWGHDRG